MKKRDKLLLVTPSGKEIKLGFMSPCRNGYVLGTSRVEGVDTSHLTIISKEETLSSHITPQEHPQNRQYFPQVNPENLAKAFQEKVEQNLVSPLSIDQLSEEVVYVTQKFLDWLDSVKNTLYEKRTSPREVIHVLNFKKLSEKLPQLIEEFKNSPSSFFGMCKAKEILQDTSKILGVTNSRLLVIPHENQLYHADFSFIINFNPVLEQQEVSSPLSEIYRGMGISQYMREVEKKKIVEKLLSKANEK
ncbi:MAG: hypothetical protein OEY24_07115 [Candidatus Bathyarchaeota archaeon]|nr:hypothetical protein [Candidatus Bathyarchaeota archaeon]MDH5495451.1 hypothetical protein [Candidatus Bathyarchaeota archaeon]